MIMEVVMVVMAMMLLVMGVVVMITVLIVCGDGRGSCENDGDGHRAV